MEGYTVKKIEKNTDFELRCFWGKISQVFRGLLRLKLLENFRCDRNEHGNIFFRTDPISAVEIVIFLIPC